MNEKLPAPPTQALLPSRLAGPLGPASGEDPLLASLTDARLRLEAATRGGLNRSEFEMAASLGDALDACREVVIACNAR